TAPVLVTHPADDAGEYSDACQTASLSLVSITPGGNACDKTFTLVWEVSDGCGNVTQQNQLFTVSDETDPVSIDPDDENLSTETGANCNGVTGISVGSVASGASFTVAGVSQTAPVLVTHPADDAGEY